MSRNREHYKESVSFIYHNNNYDDYFSAMEDLVIPFCDLHRHTLTELLDIVKVNITNIMALIFL